MVDLFFVLSGYVIYTSYADRINTAKDLLRFQFLRLGRLYPVHFIFLATFIFFEFAKYVAQSELGITSPHTQPFKENNFEAIFQQLLLIQAIGPASNAATFNWPAWSISVEFYTYLIFGSCVLLAAKSKNMLFALIALVSVLLLNNEITFGFEPLLRCLAGFFIGCLTSLATNRLKICVPRYASLLFLCAIILFLQLKTTKQYEISIYFLTAALIASIVLSKNGYLNSILKFKTLTWLGAISYSLYMSHGAIVWVSNQIMRVALKKPEIMIRGISIPQLSKAETLIACVALTLVVFVISVFVYRFVEEPMRKKSRRIAFSKLG